MKWYEIAEKSGTVKRPFTADTEFVYGLCSWHFDSGVAVAEEKWGPDAWFKASSEDQLGEMDDVLQNDLTIPIFSRRLQELLHREGIGGIQYLPVNVTDFNGRSVEGYAIANILNVRNALELKRSDYRLYSENFPEKRGKIFWLQRAVLREADLAGCDIFRLGEYLPRHIVSERFRSLFKANKCTGIGFRELECC